MTTTNWQIDRTEFCNRQNRAPHITSRAIHQPASSPPPSLSFCNRVSHRRYHLLFGFGFPGHPCAPKKRLLPCSHPLDRVFSSVCERAQSHQLYCLHRDTDASRQLSYRSTLSNAGTRLPHSSVDLLFHMPHSTISSCVLEFVEIYCPLLAHRTFDDRSSRSVTAFAT
jgi:hypothetical protein